MLRLFGSLRLASAIMLLSIMVFGGACSAPAKAPQKATGRYAFWPSPPTEPRIQFVKAFGFASDVQQTGRGNWERLLLGKESEHDTPIQKPYGVAAIDGRIYVCDIRAGGVVVLDIPKKQARLIGMTGSQRLSLPVDIAIAPDGELFVADKNRGAIMVYSADERFRKSFERPGLQPVGVAVFGDRLYVANMATQTIEIMDRRTGDLIASFGTVGDDDGQFRLPLGVDVDPDGQVYVMDMMRCRLQVFTADGALINAVGQVGDTGGCFVRPKHLAVDNDGITYVVDAAFDNVQMFDAAQQLLMHFGSPGFHPGAMNLPAGICVLEDGVEHFRDLIHPGFDAQRLIIVTNQFGNAKVSVYAFGQRREGWSIDSLRASAEAVEPGTGDGPALPAADPFPEDDAAGAAPSLQGR
jgi:DNA-binding beta-propeller fold protein YncE